MLVLTSEEEAFGLVPAEAMAAGIPVVSRRVGGTSEVVVHGETGYLVSGTRPADYAAFVGMLLDSDEELAPGRGGARAGARAGSRPRRWPPVTPGCPGRAGERGRTRGWW